MALKRMHNEAKVLAGIAQGEENAFSKLFHAYYNQLGEFVYSLVHDKEITSEIIQETFAKIWINRESLSSVKNFDAYLFIVCRNHTFNYIRRQVAERKKQAAYLREVGLTEETTEDDASWQDADKLVARAVQLLPPQQQKVFILRQQGMKNPEISQRMNLSVESVKKYQHLAMKFISEFVRAEVAISLALASILLLK